MLVKETLPVVILCGGQGTRFSGDGGIGPKPLAKVGGTPLLRHIINVYKQFGSSEFWLCVRDSDADVFTAFARSYCSDLTVCVIETGENVPTGARLSSLKGKLGGSRFFLTYGDGLADIDLGGLLDVHRHLGSTLTITAVRPRSHFGHIDIEGDGLITRFQEKPFLEKWINGGFMVCETDLIHDLGAEVSLEEHVLPLLASSGKLGAYRHVGFWQCVDTVKDLEALEKTAGKDIQPCPL
jgi:glucose-1-phosphate cytidylyltransferase